MGGKSGAMVYGIVMYDFQAERADELEAKAGEAIIVIAQSNPEWFVAKPIGRLGGPGLIPVSFIEIRDMASNTPVPNPQDAIKRAGIPRVEEWKKMAADYKNSSITLGKFDVGGGPPSQQGIEQGMERMSLQQNNSRTSQSNGQQPNVSYAKPDSKPAPQDANCYFCNSPAKTPSETRKVNNHIRPRRQPAQALSFVPRSLHGYPATASPKTNIGLSSKPPWRMGGTGNCHDTMRISMISKLRC